MTALETYRAWENSASRHVVHVMQIERGDGSAANRLTITDRPYYDKGVAGAKYHDTYPAPIHCILEEITTQESFGSTTFGDIVLANGAGRFDSLLTSDIVGQPFVVMKGDVSWSLMESDLPYRFEEIFRGQVREVLMEEGRVRLRISPVLWDLDIKIGKEGFPRGYGCVWNAPLQLIDAVDNEYKFTSLDLRSYEANMEVRDTGVELDHPDSGSDYSIVLSGGFFFGNIELAAPPAGRLTADFNLDYAYQLNRNVQWILHVDILENAYRDLISQSMDSSAVGDVMAMVAGEAAMYILDSYGTGIGAGLVRKYTLGTPGDISTTSVSGANKNIYTVCSATFLWDIWVNDAQTYMYAVGGDAISDKAYLMTFGTPGDQSTLTLQASKTLAGMATADPSCIRANPAGDRVWISFFDGKMMQFDMTAGDMSTLAADGVEFDIRVFDRSANGFTIANSGKNIYFTGDAVAVTWQCELPEAWDITEIVYKRRQYYHATATSYLDPYKIHVSAASLFCMNLSEFINQIDLIGDDYDLPPAVLESAIYSADQELAVGVHYTTLTPVGQAMTDLVRSVGGEYSVDRYGTIRLTQRNAPEDAEAYYPSITITRGAFIGDRGTHIRATGSELPARKVTMLYRRMQVVQDATELAGLSQDDQALYSRPYSLYEVTNALSAWEESEDMVLDGWIVASNVGSQAMAQRWADLKAVPRFHYELQLTLRSTALHAIWGIGDMVTVSGDWSHPDFADGDQLQVLGRDINWSRQTQVLRVTK